MSKIVVLLLILILASGTFSFAAKNASADDLGSWMTRAAMHEARSGLGVAAVNGKIYAIGGSNASGFAPSIPGSIAVTGNKDIVSTNEEFDPDFDTWTFKTPMPTPRILFAVAVYKDRIFCIGGSSSDGLTGINEVYDPATDTWETRTAMPTARSWLEANVVNGKIYLISGYPNRTLNEVYDPATDTWTTKSPSPKAASFIGGYVSAVFENKIYCIGGISEDQSHVLNQVYDTVTDTWSNGTYPPASVDGGSAAATTGAYAHRRVYLLGAPQALSQFAPLYTNQAYNPEKDNWTVAADFPTRRYNFGVAVVNDTLFAIGGHTYSFPGSFAPSAVNEQYTPIGYGTPDPKYQPPSQPQTPVELIYVTAAIVGATATTIIIAVALYKRRRKNTR